MFTTMMRRLSRCGPRTPRAPRGPLRAHSYFHSNTKTLVAFSRYLTFALMAQKQQRVKTPGVCIQTTEPTALLFSVPLSPLPAGEKATFTQECDGAPDEEEWPVLPNFEPWIHAFLALCVARREAPALQTPARASRRTARVWPRRPPPRAHPTRHITTARRLDQPSPAKFVFYHARQRRDLRKCEIMPSSH